MTGETDIFLNDNYQMDIDQVGNCKLIDGVDLFIQNIKLEALTQEGDLFYDLSYGWSLLDFIHSEYSDILKLEIVQRIKAKLASNILIDADSIKITTDFVEDQIQIVAKFKQIDSDFEFILNIGLDRINVEVILND